MPPGALIFVCKLYILGSTENEADTKEGETMGRYIRDVQLEQPIDVVSMVMEDFIYHNRFSRTDWNGEMVFYLKDSHKKERYMKWVYVDGQFHVEAWLKNSMGGETDLDGIGGGASRKEFRASIDGLIETLRKTAAGTLAGGHIGSDPLHHDSGYVNNHDVWKQDTRWQQGNAGQQGVQGGAGQQGRPAPQGGAGQQGVQGGAGRSGNAGNQSGRGTASDPQANHSVIFAVLALMFGWAMPIFGVIFIVLARKKLEYSSNPRLVNSLCVAAAVVMALGIMGNVALFFLSALL